MRNKEMRLDSLIPTQAGVRRAGEEGTRSAEEEGEALKLGRVGPPCVVIPALALLPTPWPVPVGVGGAVNRTGNLRQLPQTTLSVF